MYKTLDDVPYGLKRDIEKHGSWPDEIHISFWGADAWNRALDLMRGFPDEWPEGVEYWAQDRDGWWYPFALKPNQYKEESWNGGGLVGGVEGTIIGDWRTTLRKRPKSRTVKNDENTADSAVDVPIGDMKFDGDKIRMELLPFDALELVAEVLTFGAKKYEANSWQSLANAKERYSGAMLRHYSAMANGETHDNESELLHAAHMACDALFLLWLEKEALK